LEGNTAFPPVYEYPLCASVTNGHGSPLKLSKRKNRLKGTITVFQVPSSQNPKIVHGPKSRGLGIFRRSSRPRFGAGTVTVQGGSGLPCRRTANLPLQLRDSRGIGVKTPYPTSFEIPMATLARGSFSFFKGAGPEARPGV
jgi:hypothetical protein